MINSGRPEIGIGGAAVSSRKRAYQKCAIEQVFRHSSIFARFVAYRTRLTPPGGRVDGGPAGLPQLLACFTAEPKLGEKLTLRQVRSQQHRKVFAAHQPEYCPELLQSLTDLLIIDPLAPLRFSFRKTKAASVVQYISVRFFSEAYSLHG